MQSDYYMQTHETSSVEDKKVDTSRAHHVAVPSSGSISEAQ